jgi:hypothetical protein
VYEEFLKEESAYAFSNNTTMFSNEDLILTVSRFVTITKSGAGVELCFVCPGL